MEWWLMRHGITSWNLERKYQGHSDTGLLPGEESGLSPLRRKLAGTDFSVVFCSDLQRCRDTLAYVRPDLTAIAHYDARLREMNFGVWEGKTYEMLKDDPPYRAWIDHPQVNTPPGGESWTSFKGRIREFYEELIRPAPSMSAGKEKAPILIVTHGGVISMLGTLLEPEAGGFWNTEFKLQPGELLKIEVGLHDE